MKLREHTEIKKVLGRQMSSRRQVNKLFESDCEIVKVAANNFVVTSIDSIAEEISMGLYKNVSTWAWITVMSSVSDLATTGAMPLGITLSTQWRFGTSEKIQKQFYQEVHRACKAADVALLGGDSGYAADHVFTSSIVGHSKIKPLSRMGARDGDYIVIADNCALGLGPSVSMSYLLEKKFDEKLFRPRPSWKDSQAINKIASAGIDSSDGLTIALYTLAVLNDLGFELEWTPEIIHPAALAFCKTNKISPLLLYLNDLGDLQNIFTVPKKNIGKLPVGFTVIGRFKKQKTYSLNIDGDTLMLPTKLITQVPREKGAYARLFTQLNQDFRLFT
jgi:Thiamine monophosphate kinase